MALRVLVTGGRNYADREFLFATLDVLHADRGIACVVHGAASGADRLAGEWAKDRGVEVREYPANWKEEGRAAGPKRNRRMLAAENPQLVVAFAGGKGTADMVNAARAASVEVLDLRQATD